MQAALQLQEEQTHLYSEIKNLAARQVAAHENLKTTSREEFSEGAALFEYRLFMLEMSVHLTQVTMRQSDGWLELGTSIQVVKLVQEAMATRQQSNTHLCQLYNEQCVADSKAFSNIQACTLLCYDALCQGQLQCCHSCRLSCICCG